jgi:hypothetical protein
MRGVFPYRDGDTWLQIDVDLVDIDPTALENMITVNVMSCYEIVMADFSFNSQQCTWAFSHRPITR